LNLTGILLERGNRRKVLGKVNRGSSEKIKENYNWNSLGSAQGNHKLREGKGMGRRQTWR